MILAGLLGLSACGGETGVAGSTISGVVVDVNNDPVRDATVRVGGASTRTSSTGAYVLENVRSGEQIALAEVSRGSVLFRGRNTFFSEPNGLRQNVNIVVAPTTNRARLTGAVRDRDGFLLEGAAVWVYSGAGSSARAFTDRNGRFTVEDLIPGIVYEVNASGRTYRSDQTAIEFLPGQTRNIDFVLDNPGLPNLQPPQDITAISWVSPRRDTRSPQDADAIEWVKTLYDPGYRRPEAADTPDTRQAFSDRIVEVSLQWQEQRFPDLLGHGVYRGIGTNPLQELAFADDPLAGFWADMTVLPQRTYRYGLTTISALFPDFRNQTESEVSTPVTVRTLDLLTVLAPEPQPLRFRWTGGGGAEEFVIFIFDEFPRVGVQPLFSNASQPVTGSSYTYDGPSLQPGRQYFYLVLGLADDFSARTISDVQTFTR